MFLKPLSQKRLMKTFILIAYLSKCLSLITLHFFGSRDAERWGIPLHGFTFCSLVDISCGGILEMLYYFFSEV